MPAKTLTYEEGGQFYAVITLPNGHTYYKGPYKNRAKARRVAIHENEQHSHATAIGMIYNVRLGQ